MSLKAEFAADSFYEFRTEMTEKLETQRAQYLIVCESLDKVDAKIMLLTEIVRDLAEVVSRNGEIAKSQGEMIRSLGHKLADLEKKVSR